MMRTGKREGKANGRSCRRETGAANQWWHPALLLALALVLLLPVAAGAAEDPLDHWQWRNPLPQGEDLRAVVWSGSQYVAVGKNGMILTSPEGQTWSLQLSGTRNSLRGIAVGAGLLVAVGEGGVVLSSPDGQIWTARDSGSSVDLNAVCYGDGQFLAVSAAGTALRSVTGSDWQSAPVPGLEGLSGVVYGSGRFLAVGSSGGKVAVSPDGRQWTLRSLTTCAPAAVAYGNERFVVAGFYDQNGVIQTSPDGISWQVVHVETVVAQSRRLSGLTYALGRFVAVGEQGTILTSTDGQTWTARNSGSAENLNGVAGGAAGYLAVGSRGTILTAATGADWTARSYSPVGKGDLQVAAYGQQTFVAVSRNYPLATSTVFRSGDGVTWTPATNTIPNYVNSIAYANGLFVAVTEYTAQSKANVFTSGDGWFWSPTYTGVERSIYDVIYTGTMFLAAGDRGTLLFSSDGYGWSPLVLDGGERFQKLVYGQGSLVAIGYDKMLHSSTGLSWSSVDTKYWGKFNDLAYGNGMFVAVGDNGAILNSADGRNWDYRYAGTNGRMNAVSFSNGHFVAVGDEGLILTSPYGRSWVVRSSPTGAGLRAVIGGDQGTLAVGDGGVILSAAAGLPGVNLTAAVPTAPVGRTIAISVNSTAIPNPEYQLWLQNATDGSWSNLGSYSSREEWELSRTQPGDYTLIAYAKSAGQPESTARASNALSLSFTKEQAVTGLTVSGPSGAQPVGSSAVFTATAADAGGVPLYQFWLHDATGWRQLRAYSDLNTYTLSNLQPGSYVLAVYALDAGDVAAGNWGAAFYRVFILNVGSTVSLSREPWLPSVGNQITFIASSLGLTGAEYQFWIRDPDNNWFQTGDYNSNNTYRFIPLQAGSYRTVVFAKDHYAPATDQFAVSSEMEFTVIPG